MSVKKRGDFAKKVYLIGGTVHCGLVIGVADGDDNDKRVDVAAAAAGLSRFSSPSKSPGYCWCGC